MYSVVVNITYADCDCNRRLGVPSALKPLPDGVEAMD